ncbi:hypothetical protein X798_00507 [Onchocerca flexuosa]|uniref:Uncharacterized protein n=1 Tax=Onchocerca flexuosa TaxID=387005 RepID=A0A238C601_9BILA|nr:hypothetical protein X798_00507 [Onchocerca flexuosa]
MKRTKLPSGTVARGIRFLTRRYTITLPEDRPATGIRSSITITFVIIIAQKKEFICCISTFLNSRNALFANDQKTHTNTHYCKCGESSTLESIAVSIDGIADGACSRGAPRFP